MTRQKWTNNSIEFINQIMWEDPINKKAGRLQKAVLKCVEKKKGM